MTISRASAKNKGRETEHEIAKIMGGRRTPRSGAIGGALAADISFDLDSIYSPLHVECKRRAAIPGYVTEAYNQARAAASTLKSPAVVIRQDRGKPFVFMELSEFVTFTRALAEMGQGSVVKSLARGIVEDARKIMELA